MSMTDWSGLSGLALLWMLLALSLPLAKRSTQLGRILIAAATYCVVMLPVFGLSLAGLLRGLVGDLSITSVLLLGSALWTRCRIPDAAEGLWSTRERHGLLLTVLFLALSLYPFALGLSAFDAYRSGFGGILLLVLLGLLALGAAYRGLVLLPLAMSLGVLAWSQGCYESSNLWDYLIDVPLVLYASAALTGSLFDYLKREKRA